MLGRGAHMPTQSRGHATLTTLRLLVALVAFTLPAASLQAQMEPHFVFNALNTIASLVRTDPDRARGLVLAFADYVRVLTTWRQLPYLDPGLPPALLPDDWSGARAAELFAVLKQVLEQPAHDYVSFATHASG